MVKTAALAEQHFANDPSGALTKLRRFGELIAEGAAATVGIHKKTKEPQAKLIERLVNEALFGPEIEQMFTELRQAGNAAVHEDAGTQREALHHLKTAHTLALWFHRSFHDANFEGAPFVPPPTPEHAHAALEQRLEQLRAELAEQRALLRQTKLNAKQQADLRAAAEQEAKQAYAEAATALELGQESAELLAAERAAFEALLAKLQAAAEAQTKEQRAARIDLARKAAGRVELTEAETRERIDLQLRAAGWEVDSEVLRHGKGARPEKGHKRAISEWPTRSGPADYVLFDGLRPVGIVEVKRESKDVRGCLEQAKRYSRDFEFGDDIEAAGGPWGAYKVPFLFATNGRPFVRQFLAASGIWHLDARVPTNQRRALEGWMSPEGLAKLLNQDLEAANAKLTSESLDYLPLRPYQREAIAAVEDKIAAGQRELLLAMATGTGKTRTCICLTYRLIKAGRFNRVLFLVDRTSLGIQAMQAFENLKLEQQRSFTDIYDVKELGEGDPESDTRLQIATIQAMVSRLDADDVHTPVDQYDCIIVDECHRGYNLDREMSEGELAYRSEQEYVSKYRRVLDHFDAVKIGLTATPALHTTQIFGDPVYTYSYRRAVIEGYLVDHEPPTRITTRLSQTGVSWAFGEEMQIYRTDTKAVDLIHAPDDVQIDAAGFNKQALVPAFNRAVCRALAEQIDPSLPGKTLIFCVKDSHADDVVGMLLEAFTDRYGPTDNDAVVKITGAVDKPASIIARFKNEQNPRVAVTVDLLTTGIDVPELVNLVFLRRVRSRILYDQMIGRGTRLCPDIGKHYFRIFDAVDIYSSLYEHTDMKPVVSDVKTSFATLLEGLEVVRTLAERQRICEELIAKLQRKHRALHGTKREQFSELSGTDLEPLIAQLRNAGPDEILAWWHERPALADWLDALVAEGKVLPISTEEDEVVAITRGYGGKQPADYLESFGAYIRDNLNEIPALLVVTQRPRDLTRAQLVELRLLLAQAGYTEANLEGAWRDSTNQEMAASIIGFIRGQALGSPLVPYPRRVQAALDRILASRDWTGPQRKWLARIGKQLVEQKVVDRAVIDQDEAFSQAGGFTRLDKTFGGELEDLLRELNEAVWSDAG
ncbi:Type I restriction-modification system, restriction subunit R [Enhygromyxa salina]|uniref:Type I restriction-modification system, restriction subunit R n=2 Tax=Enhygromyxa salina TaxID=215803 RepID=A0A0C2D3N1_9BACT|nr:Type I restriction-modification system, restriction subunit R [Enhygromyxa salina]